MPPAPDSSNDVPVLIGMPGWLCAPAVFDALSDRLVGAAVVDAVPWMIWPGSRDIPAAAEALANHIGSVHDGGPVLLAGHSTGGAVVQQLVQQRPDLVSGLLLIGTGAHMRGHADVDSIIDRAETTWGRRLHEAVIDRSFAVPPEPALRENMLRYAASVPQQAAIDVLRSQRDLDFTPGLASVTVPTVVLHGSHDRARTVDQAKELTAALPTATLHILDAGHTPIYEVPDQVADVVRNLIDLSRGNTA